MSFKKIKIITPEDVRIPEKDYVYLGYGYSSTYNDTAPWIKKSDGSIILISGGTGGGGGALYWTLNAGYLKPNDDSYKVSVGDTSATQFLNVEGGISIGNTEIDTSGSIRWDGSDFQGYTGSRWVSLTASGGTSGTAGSDYWQPVAQGIQYPDGKVYIGGSFSPSSDNDILNVQGGITIGSSENTNEGTIKYNDTEGELDLEGYVNSTWRSLTGVRPINVISTSTSIDDTYHTIICTNSSYINITLPAIENALNSEFIICRYGAGNISVGATAADTIWTEFVSFYGNFGSISFDDTLPSGANVNNLLYTITIRPVTNYPTTGDATWLVVNFGTVYATV